MLAVFFDPDTTFTKADNVRVLDVGSRQRYSGPIDTSAILAEARAENDAESKGLPAYQRERRAVAPLSMRSDGDSIEVWLVPFRVLMGRPSTMVGGERGFIYSPDGRTLAREIDAFDRFRTIAIPQMVTKTYASHLVGRGSNAVWIQLPRQ